MTGSYLVRDASTADLDRIAGFEVEIAVISFGDEAITDPDLHRKRVANSLGKPGEFTMVAVAAEAKDDPIGWAWLSSRTNSLTGARYGNFRSLAVADHPDRAAVGELLLDAMVGAATGAGIIELVGKVHVANVQMRTLYRKFDFEAVHLTMRRRIGPA